MAAQARQMQRAVGQQVLAITMYGGFVRVWRLLPAVVIDSCLADGVCVQGRLGIRRLSTTSVA